MVDRVAVAARGFSLLELLVVLLLMALAVGLVGPAVGRTAETLRVRADVAGFSAMLRHAREKAITTRQPHAVVVDPAAHRISIVTGTGDVRESRPLPPRLEVQAVPPPALTVRFQPHGGSGGGEFRLAAAGVRYRVTVDPLTGRVRSRRE